MVISFAEALRETVGLKRHLLLGNGFSISLFPDIFRYGSLLEQADFSGLPEARQAFDTLTTTDFEAVIHALNQTAALLPLYNGDGALRAKIATQAEALKELLVRAIAGHHPERPSDITEEQYQACRQFLANFIGDGRDTPNLPKDLRGCIYTLNYDLLLYWTLLHTPSVANGEAFEELEHDDGFRAPDDNPDAEYVTWDGEESHSQRIHYLHGALHLHDYGFELQKKCWERAGGRPLIDQIHESLDEGRVPLFVAEGATNAKFERIRHSAYLHKGLRSFRGICDVKGASLFIFGHSLADNDAHILKQLRKGKIGAVYISLYGDPTSPENREIIRRAEAISAARSDRYPLVVRFFDATSAQVWG